MSSKVTVNDQGRSIKVPREVGELIDRIARVDGATVKGVVSKAVEQYALAKGVK